MFNMRDIAEASVNLGKREKEALAYTWRREDFWLLHFLYDVDLYLERLDVRNATIIFKNMDANDAVDALTDMDSSIVY